MNLLAGRYRESEGIYYGARKQALAAIVPWVQHRILGGDLPYFLTFQFRPLRGSLSAVLAQMQDEVVRCYATLLRNAFRRPGKLPLRALPLLVCAPDLPVCKGTAKRKLRGSTTNGGLHFHAIALLPSDTRLRDKFIEHIKEKQSIYASRRTRLLKMDAQPIVETPENAVDYAMKAIKNGKVAYDDLLILPKVYSELGKRYSLTAVPKLSNQTSHGKLGNIGLCLGADTNGRFASNTKNWL